MQTHRSDHKILNPTFPLVVISTVSYCYVTLALLLAVKMETSKNMWMCSGELEVCREISLNTFKGYTLDKGYLGVGSILFNGPCTKTHTHTMHCDLTSTDSVKPQRWRLNELNCNLVWSNKLGPHASRLSCYLTFAPPCLLKISSKRFQE